MVKVLYANNTKCYSEVDDKGFTPLHFAAHFGHTEVMEYFKKKRVAYPFSYDGTSCLHVAVNRNQVAFVKYLLKKTPPNPVKLEKNQSFISRKVKVDSAEERKEELINFYQNWEEHVNVNERKHEGGVQNGISAAFIAVKRDDLKMLELLISFGAELKPAEMYNVGKGLSMRLLHVAC